ncbi:MAG: DUF3093 domain-containing protein [Beutenbergiaceae bacterium]
MHSYSETLWPSFARWMMAPGAAIMAGLSTLPLGLVVASAAAVVAALATAVYLWLRTPSVTVTTDGLRAGRAFVEARFLGAIEPLGPSQTRAAMGPQLREDAYVLHRSWVPQAVRIELVDDADPTPYWLLSTRNPTDLTRALEHCRDGAEGQAAHSEQTG